MHTQSAMNKKSSSMTDLHATLFKVAMRLPGAKEGISCKGTALEQPTVTVGKKAFLFLGKTRIMLKLSESISDCARLAKEQPDVYKSGAGGWTTITVVDGNLAPASLLKRWVEESYQLVSQAKPAKKPAANRRKP